MELKKKQDTVWLAAILFLLLGSILFAGCRPAEDAVPQAGQEIAAVDVVEVELAEPTAVPTMEATASPALLPVDYCLDCHINKDMLIDTADPEEEVISENEGEG